MEVPNRFIFIDDDSINNMICRMLVTDIAKESEILTFEIPEKGFEYIANEYAKNGSDTPTMLFLDINMPTWSGWEFLESYEKLEPCIKNQIKVYMLSSSINQRDMERAAENKNVVDYIKKPLSKKTLLTIIS